MAIQIVGRIDATIFPGETALIYRFAPRTKSLLIHCFPKGIAFVFSFFARTISGTEVIHISLEGPHSSQTKEFRLNENWRRYEVAIRNDISLKPLDIYLTTQVALRQHSDIAIKFPQGEDGLCATPPIAPEVQLPALADNESGEGGRRDADRVWIDEDKTGLFIDSSSATALMVAEPAQRPDQILETQFLSFLSFWSSKSRVEVSIGISGLHGCQFVLRIRSGKDTEYVESGIIGGHQLYFVCVVFDHNEVSVIINGA
ncbi:MAG: hypothetical protein KGJ53_14225, partial [Alphaproteobacteria bacterium]|nr:hypothetical protein [Alphaproteobacteria bacterium]